MDTSRTSPPTTPPDQVVLTPLPSTPPPAGDDPLGFPGYRDRLAAARDGDPDAESLEVGTATVGELEVVVARGIFGFLGGSMGTTHGDRFAHAAAVALERRLPLLVVTSSGGARMQEGMRSLVQMSRASEGVRRLRAAGIPVIGHLTHPTTGGVNASYGSLADVAVAEAGATIGFAGPRVVEAFTGDPVGDDSHTAEVALTSGLVDATAAPGDALPWLTRAVRLLHPATRSGALPSTEHVDEPTIEHDAWDAVRRARRADRPSARDLLHEVFDEHLELRGDRAGTHDPAVVTAVARLGARTVVVVGFDRRGVREGGRPGQAVAAGYRQLQRALRLADRYGAPVVALVDTPGADPSPASDRAGLATAIAETFVAMLSVSSPTVAVVTGEGGSGGALAIAATDRLLMQDDAVFEVIAPEGAAAILHRDPTRAEEVAGQLAPTASDLRRLGICDRTVPGPTTFDTATAAAALRAELSATLTELEADRDRLAARAARYGPAPS
ncbi:MAG: carboxyl transferase domain-containing protein [Nitriliruptor sp.]